MRKDKENAVALRRSGKSYNTILKELKIPKSTLSGWFRDVDWSKELRTRLSKANQTESTKRIRELDKVRGVHLKRAYEEAREEAMHELDSLKYNPLFIAGLMLYWGEGDKLTKSLVSLTNADPKMVKLFIFFLTKICKLPESKIRLHLLLYPDLDDWLSKAYWMRETGMPKENFTKSTVIAGKHKTRRLSFGICIVNVSSTYFKVKMLEWLKSLPDELMKESYYVSM